MVACVIDKKARFMGRFKRKVDKQNIVLTRNFTALSTKLFCAEILNCEHVKILVSAVNFLRAQSLTSRT